MYIYMYMYVYIYIYMYVYRLTRHAGQCWRIGTSSYVTYSCGLLHMDEQRKDDQHEPTYNSSVPIRDVVLKTCRKQWTIGSGGERESAISVLMEQHDEDGIYIYIYILLFKIHLSTFYAS